MMGEQLRQARRAIFPSSNGERKFALGWMCFRARIGGRNETHAGTVAFASAGGLAGVFEGGVVDGLVATGTEFAALLAQFFLCKSACAKGGFFLVRRLIGHRSSQGLP
jgi:hypothetical protein